MELREALINQEDETGMFALSFVLNPATKIEFEFFNEEYQLSNFTDEEKRQVVGPIMIPNMKILRRDKNTGEPYEMFFSKETIDLMGEKFLKNGFNRNVTIGHKSKVDDVNLKEIWIKESDNDKSSDYGFSDLPVGTLFAKYKVNNFDLWKKIKSGEVQGFSLESILDTEVVDHGKDRFDEMFLDVLYEFASSNRKKIRKTKKQREVEKRRKAKTLKSSNVKDIKYLPSDEKLTIRFHGGKTYVYKDINTTMFLRIAGGKAKCITKGSNKHGTWWVNKYPSVGAAVYKYLVKTNHPFTKR